MNSNTRYIIQGIIAGLIVLSAGFSDKPPEKPQTGYWAMNGNLVTHYFADTTDTLSGPEIYELQDDNGLPIWFGRHIFKDVCMSGECKMIRLWLFWDGAGNFLGIQLHETEPLTKSDHTEFDSTDYKKLEAILGDSASVLKELNPEDLIIVPDSINPYQAYEVDGYTAATQPAIAGAVVKDAVYTCHTLWHTVYGPAQNAIQKINHDRLNENYLSLWFNSPNPSYNSWALLIVKGFQEFHISFSLNILNCIKSENEALAKQALDYFQSSHLQEIVLQKKMAELIPDVSTREKYDILWKLTALKAIDEEVVLKLLHFFEEEKLDVGSLNLIFRMISAEHLQNKKIKQHIDTLSTHENNYIRNLTRKLTEGFK